MLPRIITGSSAGSIISAVISCYPDDELLEMFRKGDLRIEAFVEVCIVVLHT
jgi:predicted acylesterase/phospholipase RssA